MNLPIKLCVCWALLFCCTDAYSQVNLNITADNIKQSSIYVDKMSTNFATILSVAPTINLSTASNTLTRTGGGTGVSSNLITARIIGTGGGVANLLDIGTVPTIALSSTPQAIYASLIGTLAGGNITLRYSIPNLGNTIWRAGTYSSTLNFALLGINVGLLSPTSVPLNLTVDPFITIPASVSPIELNVNSLDYFRTQTITATQSNLVTTTVPVGIRVKANSSAFSYSNGYSGATDPGTSTSRINAQLTLPVTGASVTMGSGYNNLINSFSVPSGNQQSNVITYSIPPATLKGSFLQQGNYSTILNYEFFDAGTTVQATAKSLSSAFTVKVDDMAELKVNHADINLEFNTADDFNQGVYADMRAHVTVSKTTPYDVYIKASGSNLTSGSNTLPVTLIDIMPVPDASSNFNTLQLSATPQKLVSAAAPVIDRDLDIRYSIPSSKTAQLINKASGIYTTTITYSIIAP